MKTVMFLYFLPAQVYFTYHRILKSTGIRKPQRESRKTELSYSGV